MPLSPAHWSDSSLASHLNPLTALLAHLESSRPARSPGDPAPTPASDIARWLSNRRLEPSDDRHMALLHCALTSDSPPEERLAIVRALLDAGADPNHACRQACPHARRSPIAHAASKGLLPEARLLIERGALPRQGQSGAGPTPLFCAVADTFCPGMIELLCSSGADPHETTETGHTPLHAAALFDRPQAVRPLLLHGADPHLKPRELGCVATPFEVGANIGSGAFLAELESALIELCLARPEPLPQSRLSPGRSL